MKNIQYRIHINAQRQKVWETMIDPDTYKEWANASWPDSTMKANGKKMKK